MGVLAPRLHTLDVSACPPINTSENFRAPLNTSSNLSEVISEVSEVRGVGGFPDFVVVDWDPNIFVT
jgi:hypothetical protein